MLGDFVGSLESFQRKQLTVHRNGSARTRSTRPGRTPIHAYDGAAFYADPTAGPTPSPDASLITAPPATGPTPTPSPQPGPAPFASGPAQWPDLGFLEPFVGPAADIASRVTAASIHPQWELLGVSRIATTIVATTESERGGVVERFTVTTV